MPRKTNRLIASYVNINVDGGFPVLVVFLVVFFSKIGQKSQNVRIGKTERLIKMKWRKM